MQKILFLADLHGNMPATLALEKEIEKIKPDDIWFLGDAVGKGPESDKTLDWVRKNWEPIPRREPDGGGQGCPRGRRDS